MKKFWILIIVCLISACNKPAENTTDNTAKNINNNIVKVENKQETNNMKEAPNNLITAVQKGDAQLVRELIKKGADINAKDELGANALTWAVWSVSPIETANQIRSQKCDIFTTADDIKNKYQNYPTSISKESQAEIVKVLINAGVNLNEKDNYIGETPLIYAVKANNKEIVKLLIESGADVNITTDNTTPLFAAAINGQTEIAKLLIDSGADVNAILPIVIQGKAYRAGISKAYLKCSILHIMLLEQDKIQSILKPKNKGEYSLDYVNSLQQKGKQLPGIIKMLKNAKAKNIRKQYRPTPNKPKETLAVSKIKEAVQNKNIEEINNLLKKEIDLSDKSSALVLAAKNGDIEIAKLLIDSDADVNADIPVRIFEDNHIPLSSDEQKTNCWRIIETRTTDTPLLEAAINGHIEMVKILINSGANVNIIIQRMKEVCNRCADPVYCRKTRYGETLLKFLEEQHKDSPIANYSEIIKILGNADAKKVLEECNINKVLSSKEIITFDYRTLSEINLKDIDLRILI